MRIKKTNTTLEIQKTVHQFQEHGINRQIIVMSSDELFDRNKDSNGIVQVLLGTWVRTFRLYDPSIILINQVMYTFHRQKMIIMDNSTMESWYWTEDHFHRLHPLLLQDFQGNYFLYFQVRVASRLSQFLWYTFSFATVSAINAIFIRVALKCSSLMIFPMIAF